MLGTGHREMLEDWSLLLSHLLSNPIDRHTDNSYNETGKILQQPPLLVKILSIISNYASNPYSLKRESRFTDSHN